MGKKEKKIQENEAVVEEVDEIIVDKKKNKKKRERESIDEESEQVVTEVAEDDADDEAARLEKKRLKKERKAAKKLRKQQQEEGAEGESNYITTESNKKINKSSSITSSNIGNYVEASHITSMTASEVTEYRDEHSIQVFPEEKANNIKPMTEFDDLYPSLSNHCPHVNEYLIKKKFKTPSPIQAQVWPPLLMGYDAIGIAATGSGKTLAFLIPILLKLAKLGPNLKAKSSTPCPRVLIVSPTRELACQSHDVAVEIGGPTSVCIYGGVPKHEQKTLLRQGADIVVATPGKALRILYYIILYYTHINYSQPLYHHLLVYCMFVCDVYVPTQAV